jgi:hypothetical protein
MLPGLKNGQKISNNDPSSAIFMGDSEVSHLIPFFLFKDNLQFLLPTLVRHFNCLSLIIKESICAEGYFHAYW